MHGTLIAIRAPLAIKKISAVGGTLKASKSKGSKLKSHDGATLRTKYAIDN